MPMTARSNYITMSPELLHKLESTTPNHGPDHGNNAGHDRQVDNTNTLFHVLEKSIDASRELIIPEQYRPERHRTSEHYLVKGDSQDSTSSRTHTKSTSGSHSESLNEDTRSVNLFDVSVDINEHFPVDSDSSSDEDGTISMSSPTNTRRSSHWRATVLFVASDVQLTVNLAELCLPDGFETAPRVSNLYFNQHLR